ncbi:hypothetical protein A2X44_05100 [candidate division CPR3 bacterium GWF2_35_18]|uniref:Hydrolase, NUDIX family n=1 Tax=candidate division CPR3 bacterium GW2011_GWF2_35_18 TaxID=1618350 RepID=A0A0G0BJZ4_UNCC3|nr:MAG: Hydrolase, NUDIX family [candidate division CPR3 bacterium GW2011_GWF2_35_18]KKP87245.1 MAG: Hydrolase, NUDIX family [candidate division CPR3 bacterium GW2011_GWE2_35_7]OGB63707.1 MAG: hypothetical protein A2X44_05100 [candidate division CPR3 bacterium GWF2_35_18]OGB64973.1 MAG: hypothetical protein A2250_00945 [candidate division CPR3 bacterium RIFOXYA2_FULL_35_13]OGB78544.1 MAG: hypothetical protein A2296_01985 [candidate division CPR3 bacterium RIFOXYB2_FULL_35_8]OGB79705.1 MAG: hyp
MVDEQNNNKIVISVLGVIFDTSGKVLLSLRSDKEIPLADFKWEIPGGKIDFGETATECIVREIREETGLIVNPVRLVDCIWSNIWDTNAGHKIQAILIPFLCEVDSGVTKPGNHEVLELKWFSMKEIDSLNTLPGVKEIVRTAYFTKKGVTYGKSKDGL